MPKGSDGRNCLSPYGMNQRKRNHTMTTEDTTLDDINDEEVTIDANGKTNLIRKVRINVGGDSKIKRKHHVNWCYSFPVNDETQAKAFLAFRAYAYAARSTLQEAALRGLTVSSDLPTDALVLTATTPAMTQEQIMKLALDEVMTPNAKKSGGGGGNPALASKAQAFAGLVKSGALARETVLPLLATGKATMEDAIVALDKAIAKLA